MKFSLVMHSNQQHSMKIFIVSGICRRLICTLKNLAEVENLIMIKFFPSMAQNSARAVHGPPGQNGKAVDNI